MSRVTLVTIVEALEIMIISNLLLARATGTTRRQVWVGIVGALILSTVFGVIMFFGLEEAEESFEGFEHAFAGFVPVILAALLVWHVVRSHRLSSEITGLLAFGLILVEGLEIVLGTAGEEARNLVVGIVVIAVTFAVLVLVFELFEAKLPIGIVQRYATGLIALMAIYQLIHAREEMEEGGYESWWWLSLAVTVALLAYWLPRFFRGHNHVPART